MTRPALPDGALPLTRTRLAVLCAVAVQRRPTTRSVAEYAGVPPGTAHSQLETLRRIGLVDWAPLSPGTLHACFVLVPVKRAE